MELNIILILIILSISLFQLIYNEEITIFSGKNQISFAKIIDYKVSLMGSSEGEITEYIKTRSFLSVIVNVTLSKECLLNKNVRMKFILILILIKRNVINL